MRPTAVSLFAGVGGIDLALQRAGYDVVAAVEKDPAARGVLADRLPDTTLFPDVTEVSADDLRATGFVPDRGLVAAGWPCQGNSVAGPRGGLADPRSGLWAHVVRLLAELHPRWFLGENVPGLLSVTEGEDFGIVVQQLAELGYGFSWRVLDAQHFGVPQRRRRIFIVGRAGDTGAAPAQVLLEPESGQRDSAAGQEARQGAAGRTAGSAGDSGVAGTVSTLQGGGERGHRVDAEAAAGGHLIPQTFQKVIRSGERDANGDLPPEVWAERDVTATLNCIDNGSESRATELVVQPLALRGRDEGAEVELGPAGGPANALRTPGGGSSHGMIAFAWQADGKDDASGAFNDDGTTPTLPKSQTLAVHHETTVRRLTPLECERLQGFPDGWTATSNGRPQADSARYRQMGNAVAVPCVEWITRRIAAVEATP